MAGKTSPKKATKRAPKKAAKKRRRKSADTDERAAGLGGQVNAFELTSGKAHPLAYDTFVQHLMGYAYAAIRAVAQGVSEQPVNFYTKPPGAKRKTDWQPLPEKHPLVDLLSGKVNAAKWTFRELMEDTVGFLELTGNAYWYKARDKNGKGKPRELWPLAANEVKVLLSKNPRDRQIVGYLWTPVKGEEGERIPADDVVHFKLFNPRSRFYGLAPFAACAHSQNADEAIVRAQDYMMRSVLSPAAVFVNKGKRRLTQKDRKRMDLLLKRHMSASRVGRALYLSGDWDMKDLNKTPKEMDFAASGKITRDRILGVFGVSPGVLGLLENASRSNVEATTYTFAKYTLKPILSLMEDRINADISLEFGENLVAEFDDPVPRDREADRADWESAGKLGFVTANEYRQEFLGLEKTDDGDERLVPMNYVPASMVGTALGAGGGGGGEPEEVEEDPAFKPDEDGVVAAEHVERAMRDALAEMTAGELANWVADVEAESVVLDGGMREHTEELVKTGAATEAAVLGIDPTDINMSAEPFVKALNERARDHWAETVNLTNRDELQVVIAQGMEDGLSTKEVANQIQGHFEDVSVSRSRLISRTEIVGSLNSGSNALHKTAGIERKEWLATMDSRVRPSHGDTFPAGANRQVVSIDEPFIVGGAEMAYPGDPAGPAKEVCDCRCAQLPVLVPVEEGEAGFTADERAEIADMWLKQFDGPEEGVAEDLRAYLLAFASRAASRLLAAG